MFELQAQAKCLHISPWFGSKNSRQLLSQLAHKMWNKNVQHTLKHWGLCYVPHPPFIFSSSLIQYLCIFMLKM